jgi:hypothetical protein
VLLLSADHRYLKARLACSLGSLLTSSSIPFSPSCPSLAPASPPPAFLSQQYTCLKFLPSLTPPPIDPLPRQWVSSADLEIEREPQDGPEDRKIDNPVPDIYLVSFAGASDPKHLGSSSGLSFARIVFAAVKSGATDSSTGENGLMAPAMAHLRPVTSALVSSPSPTSRRPRPPHWRA